MFFLAHSETVCSDSAVSDSTRSSMISGSDVISSATSPSVFAVSTVEKMLDMAGYVPSRMPGFLALDFMDNSCGTGNILVVALERAIDGIDTFFKALGFSDEQKYEYMFGPSLLVSPVTQPDVSTWDTYLPKNDAGWYDFRTGKYYEGGQTVTTDARRIPVFVRGGSILPLCKDRQYALDQPDSPLEIQVYPGKDASFTLYQDDGVSNNYQNGQWSSAELQWDEKQRQLHVNEKSGNSNPPKKLKYSIKIIPR